MKKIFLLILLINSFLSYSQNVKYRANFSRTIRTSNREWKVIASEDTFLFSKGEIRDKPGFTGTRVIGKFNSENIGEYNCDISFSEITDDYTKIANDNYRWLHVASFGNGCTSEGGKFVKGWILSKGAMVERGGPMFAVSNLVVDHIKSSGKAWAIRERDGVLNFPDTMRIRNKPGINGTKVIGKLNAGCDVLYSEFTEQLDKINGIRDRWIHINYKHCSGKKVLESRGWVFAGYAKKSQKYNEELLKAYLY